MFKFYAKKIKKLYLFWIATTAIFQLWIMKKEKEKDGYLLSTYYLQVLRMETLTISNLLVEKNSLGEVDLLPKVSITWSGTHLDRNMMIEILYKICLKCTRRKENNYDWNEWILKSCKNK